MASETVYEMNKRVYRELRRGGELEEGNWIIIADGRLHLSTSSEQEAVRYLYETDVTDAYFVQVGDEDRVHHV